MEDRAPAAPWSEDAELAVLSAAMIDGEARRLSLERLAPDDFYREAHRRIFAAFARLNGRGQTLDVVTLCDELKSRDHLAAVGGKGFLKDLMDLVPTAANVEHHVEVLREKATLRRFIGAADDVAREARQAGAGQAAEVAARALERFREAADRAGGDLDDRTWDYAEMAEDPDLLEPPDEVVPRVAFREHVTLLSSDAKAGKTTVAAAGAAAVANGDRFLGRTTERGTVLWLKGEGHRRMVYRYLNDFGAEPVPGRITVVESGVDPVTELETLARRLEPDLVVVDTWTSWTATLGLDYWKAADVAPVLKRLEAVARSGPAVLLLHHNRRSDQQPRGSGHLMAAVDLLRTIEDGSHDRERKVGGRGRVTCDPFRYRLVEAGDRTCLQLVDPNREAEEKILDFVEANPGASKSAIRQGVDARATRVDEALDALVRDGLVEVDRSGPSHAHRIRGRQDGHATNGLFDDGGPE